MSKPRRIISGIFAITLVVVWFLSFTPVVSPPTLETINRGVILVLALIWGHFAFDNHPKDTN